MQFIEDGPDIPNELIAARDNGEVIFICGAGVSCHVAKLPLFKKLVEKIYDDLKEEKHGIELKTFCKGDYDQTLWSLEKRIGGGRTGRQIITRVIHRILQEPYNTINCNFLIYHKTLLELSTENPILTTNFDTLFEKAVNTIKSHHGPAFPDFADEEEFKGVIHLHGRLKDESLQLENSPLILTLKDFAEAYMREGWASRFLYKIARKYHIVFIGYSAKDYFLKLLLPAIIEDRHIFKEMKQICAFSKEEDKELWETLGVTTIIFQEYELLHKSLAEWVEYIQNPDREKERINSILSGNPDEES